MIPARVDRKRSRGPMQWPAGRTPVRCERTARSRCKVARQRFRLPLQGARASTLGEPERGHGNGQVRDHAHNTGAPIYCFAGSLIYLKYNGHQNPIKIIKAPVLDPYAVQSSVCSHAQLHEAAENIARARALAASSAMDPEAPLSLN